jgi:hypothetical protein
MQRIGKSHIDSDRVIDLGVLDFKSFLLVFTFLWRTAHKLTPPAEKLDGIGECKVQLLGSS